MNRTQKNSPPRIFIGLVEVSGRYRALKHGFDMLGITSTQITLNADRFEYGTGYNPILVRALRACIRKEDSLSRAPNLTNKVKRLLYRLLRELMMAPLFLWALKNHDLFIFGYGSSFFFRKFDYFIIKAFKKCIICQFHGSDTRPPYLDGTVAAQDYPNLIQTCVQLAQKTKSDLRRIEKYADILINTPPQGYFHERKFVLRLKVGIPSGPFSDTSLSVVAGQERVGNSEAFRILHAPSLPKIKGTLEIRAIIERLQNRGHRIELILAENLPNQKVLELLTNCDLVVDQMYVDFGMPGLATEAAWHGKACVLAGYSAGLWHQLLSAEEAPPTVYCDPSELENEIDSLIRDPKRRLEIGRRAKEFVNTKWHPKTVAENYLKLYEGDIPSSWIYDPQAPITELWGGFFMSRARTQAVIAQIIDQFGKRALQMEDKPAIEALLVNFARDGK